MVFQRALLCGRQFRQPSPDPVEQVRNKQHLELARNALTVTTCSRLLTEQGVASHATETQFVMEKICWPQDQDISGAVLSLRRYWNASTSRLVLEEIWTLQQESVQRATQGLCVALAILVTTSRPGRPAKAVDLGTAPLYQLSFNWLGLRC